MKYAKPEWLSRLTRPLPLAVLGAIAVGVATFHDNLGFLQDRLLPLLKLRVPLYLALLVAVVCVLAIRLTLRKHHEPEPRPASLKSHGEFLEIFQDLLVCAENQIRVSGLNAKEWVFPLLPSIAIARMHDVKIDVVCNDGAHERYTLLENLGCTVHRQDGRLRPMVLKDPRDIRYCEATVCCPRPSDMIVARCYYGSLDYHAITACDEVLTPRSATDRRSYCPELVEVDDQSLVDALQKVQAYRNSRIHLEEVIISQLHPISSEILRYKLKQVEHLIRLYEKKNWQLFRACGLLLDNGEVSLLIPPVVEKHDGLLTVAEGHTRLYFLRLKGVKQAKVALVEGVTTPPPHAASLLA